MGLRPRAEQEVVTAPDPDELRHLEGVEMTRLGERRKGLPLSQVARAGVPYHTATVGRAIEGAGSDERVVIARPGMPEDPRVPPRPLGPQGAFVALAVVVWVGLDERVGRVLSPTREVCRGR